MSRRSCEDGIQERGTSPGPLRYFECKMSGWVSDIKLLLISFGSSPELQADLPMAQGALCNISLSMHIEWLCTCLAKRTPASRFGAKFEILLV